MLSLHKDLKVRENHVDTEVGVGRAFPAANIASAKALRLEFDWRAVSSV